MAKISKAKVDKIISKALAGKVVPMMAILDISREVNAAAAKGIDEDALKAEAEKVVEKFAIAYKIADLVD